MEQFIYAPILKWKAGEIAALENLLPTDKNLICPIIDFVGDMDFDFSDKIYNIFGNYNNIFIPILFYNNQFQNNIIPVTEYQNYQNYNMKKAILIKEEEIEDAVLNDNGSGDLYIILDIFKLYEANILGYKKYLINSFFNNNYDLLITDRVKGIIISCTSFPDTETSGNIPTNSTVEYQKFEMNFFKDIKNIFSQFKNKLIFSDYGTTKFTSEVGEDQKYLLKNAADKIKYSAFDKYIFKKGKKDVKNYVELAKELINHPDFLKGFDSYGNKEIEMKATGNNRVGNHMNWVTYCCNHHIVLVLRQLVQ